MRVARAFLLAVVLSVWPVTGSAQPSCRFVLGFADLAARLGPDAVGTCLENQRTITEQERFDLGGLILDLPAGTAVQRTSTGVLAWLPEPNITEFNTAQGYWRWDGADVAFYRWPDAPPAAASQPPAPAAPQGSRDAGANCFQVFSNELLAAPLGAPPSVRQAAKERADAAFYLCSQAADKDGPNGIRCFSDAWNAATGMERVFPGSGMRVYDEKYRACIAGR